MDIPIYNNLSNYTALTYFFDLEEIEILAEVLQPITYLKGETVHLSSNYPMLVVSKKAVSDYKQALEALDLKSVDYETNISFTVETEVTCFTLKNFLLKKLLFMYPFLTLKLNQILDSRLTYLFCESYLIRKVNKDISFYL